MICYDSLADSPISDCTQSNYMCRTMKRQDPKSNNRQVPAAKLRAWRALFVPCGHLAPRLDEEMRAETELDFKSYDALLHTYEAGAAGIRMADLAERVVLSKSGLTTLVDRLEGRGLVRRLPDHADRRATRITITEAGLTTFRAAAEVHLAGIARLFAGRITTSEAEALSRILERFGGGPPPGP